MTNKELAERLVDELFEDGSEPGWPCHRIEFKLTQNGAHERAGAGYARLPLVAQIAHILDSIPQEAIIPVLDAPDSPGQWWCWRDGHKGELCVDVIFDLDRPVIRYFSGCYLLKGDWVGLKWSKVERPRR